MILSAIPWVALQIDRAIRGLLRGFGGAWLAVLVLLAIASVPLIMEGSRQQPTSENVDGLRDGVSSLSAWVRMSGRIVTLSAPEQVASGQQIQSLLIEPSGDAILMLSHRSLVGEETITGHVSNSAAADEVARRVGGPRFPDEDLDVVERYVLTVDDPIVPIQDRDWTAVWLLIGAAGLLAAGTWIGYPVVWLRSGERGEGARPMAVGEKIGVRAVERSEETGMKLRAPRGTLERLPHRDEDDPYFALHVEGSPRPLLFRRHQWSSASGGRLWMVADSAPVIELRDWGIQVILACDNPADQARVLRSFVMQQGPATAVAHEAG